MTFRTSTEREAQMAGSTETSREADVNALLGLGESVIAARVLHLAADIGVADHFNGSPVTVEWLAERTATAPPTLRGFLRVLAGHGVFAELPDGRFEITPRGALLRTEHPDSVRSILRRHEFSYGLLNHVENGVRAGAPAFDDTMVELSRLDHADVLAAYDFTPYPRIVDVGGGDGTFLAAILATYPSATGVVFEQEHVLPVVEKTRAEHQLEDRMAVAGGDFFAGVAPVGDLYVLKSIIHNWPKEQARVILGRCHEAMPAGARLVLFERVLHPDSKASQTEVWEILMLAALNAHERTMDEFEELFTSTGFESDGVTRVGPDLCAIEAVRVP